MTWRCFLSVLFVCSDSQLFNTGTDFKDSASSNSEVRTRGTCDVRKQSSVTQATQTSPEVPLPSQSATFPEGSVDITREQVLGT